ncbi:inner centromere protein-like isoform X1 [Mobula birostris]|uniref:inner centromere protein-like isoform X1 n=1 Tax=Mobula birostris TaxID=1983395 RepID=UPI003B27FB37
MASKTAMVDTDNMKYFSEKLNTIIEDFEENTVWLKEILEEAERMFISDFNAEPELMPKTPSERKRRRRRPSVAGDHNKRYSKSRKNLRRSSVQRKKLGSRLFAEDDGSNKIVEQTQSLRLTRSATRAAMIAKPESEKNNLPAIVPVNGVMPLIILSPNECKVVEFKKKGQVTNLSQIPCASEDVKLSQKAREGKLDPSHEVALEILSPVARSPSRTATKVKIAEPVTDEENEIKNVSPLTVQELNNVVEASTNGENCISATETKGLRRSVRRSIASRQSKCMSLVKTQRTVMLQRSMRKSLRKFNRKNVLQTSPSCQDNNDDFEGDDEKECSEIKEVSTEDTSRIVEVVSSTPPKRQQPKVVKQPDTLITENQERRYTRNATKLAVSNPENEVEPAKSQSPRSSPRIQKKDSGDSDKSSSSDGQSAGRKRSYKYAVANSDDYSEELEKENSSPRKKTPSPPPPFTTNKVVQPKHKSFLHTVQKNQLLMTPVSVSRTVVKSFIKRNTPLKVDPKDLERVRLENHKKKREQEEERIQKVEEQKKRKVEECKKKREMQVKRFLETRSRVQQQEEEKKKKIEQKFAQIDEKNAKVREERFAEKGKKKVVTKRMEEAEARRRQEEEARKQKLQQLEEERQIMLQQKKQEELEHQRKMVEARKLQEQRQAELERERQREHQLAVERERERIKEQEKIQAEKERAYLEKKRALQLQRELERAAREDAALQAEREKEKQEEKQLADLERQRLEKEKIRKEQEIKEQQENEKRNRENEERKWKEEQDKKAEKEVASKNILNVTVEVHHTPPPESYTMTPNTKVKIPKVNLDDYGMDLNSDDSTDDEGAPRKPIPVWASGKELQKALLQQYYHPIDLDKFFGVIQPPNLETIFSKSKPRYLKRTSSAVWHSPPLLNRINVPYSFKKY